MGRSFDDANKPDKISKDQLPEQGSNSLQDADLSPASGSSPYAVSPNSSSHESPKVDNWGKEILEQRAGDQLDSAEVEILSETFNVLETDDQVVHVPRNGAIDYVPAPWGLVDPLMKDFSPLTRFYLSHCMSCYFSKV